MVGKLEILCAEPCGTSGLSTQNEPRLLKPSSSKSLIFFIEVKWKSLNHVRLFETPWTVARQAPLSMGILQARILEWVAMLSSRGSSQPRDQTQVSRNVGGFFTVLSELPGKPIFFIDSTYMLDSSPSLFQRLHPFYLLLMMKLWIIFSVMAGEVMKGRGL